MYLYTIWDDVAKDSCPPFVAKNDGVACRSFADLCKKATSPRDYKLMRIGSFSSETASIELSGSVVVDVDHIYKALESDK